ncbi:unnamed protein product [Miscanthus lutarioriparius]|uniref:Rp1-like protein n=1 Tax=Miscanthus lutarioriparius TaxID=422564 RepID=A0A811RF92_9POAL|nr:unnamed protein product [Miscanthus lutarioriparius]
MALAGLRWAASPIVNKVLPKASDYLSVDMVRELQQLEATVLPQFELVIQAAEKSPHRGKLEAWLRRLKEAFYDAEDLVDEHEYNLLKRKAKSGKDPLVGEHETSSIASTIMKPFHTAKSRARNLLPENRRLISKMNELKAILTEAKELRDLLGLPHSNTAEWPAVAATIVPTTTSLPTSKVFGRDKDRDRIVDFLLGKTTADKESSSRYSGLAIVGAGGMGKSTLAQYVYNDKRIEECFDVKMWVCISRKLDVHCHTREIIESAKKGECPRLDNLDTLQCKLHDILQGSQKFLLVLDDIWFEKSDSETEWEQLLAPLVSKQSGSRILVTSRLEMLPAAVCCEQVVRLENMDSTEFLALLKHYAFSGAEIEDQLLRMKLEHTAKEIAKKLGQCPLAAKVLGSRLSRKKDITEWKAAQNFRDLSEPFTVLLWSYEKLDPYLQRCFLYCSLFPKGHRYKPDELVHLWVAEGFVGSCNSSRKTLEDVGMDYVNDMVSGSFFQLVSERYDSYYVMHDILHDLAESLSREDCFRLEDDNVTEIPCTVRHLSVHVESMQKHNQIIYKLHHLRTIICIDPLMDDASDLFYHMLRNQRKLRVLYLSFYNSSKLPESIGELKHLRYLNLIRTLVSELPRSLCTLYHLQLLWLNCMVASLPKKLCNLSKLRHLGAYACDTDDFVGERPICQIPNIGKLTSLQHIYVFSVQKKEGYELRQLKNLNQLHGSLRIKNLENATGKDEALESKLYQKKHLEVLKFVWSCQNDMDATDNSHLDILEGLRPPPQLSGLTIKGYKSATYPRWLLEGSYFENLGSFGLASCSLLEGLPPDTELLRHCSRLHIKNVPNLKKLSYLPAGLTKLSIHRCPLLIFITNNELLQHDLRENIMNINDLASKLASMWEVDSGSHIRRVLSKDCSSLKQFMTLMDDDISQHLQIIGSALHEGDIISVKENIVKAWLFCHEQRIRVVYGRTMEMPLVLPSGLCELSLSSCSITDEALAICLGRLISLETLELKYNMVLTALPSEEVFEHLTKLDVLKLQGCWCLKSLGGLRAAPSLSILYCTDCPSLELTRGAELMQLNVARHLSIHGCILAADSFINVLPHLKSLSIDVCRSSPSLSIAHLTSLETLSLWGLPDLSSLIFASLKACLPCTLRT